MILGRHYFKDSEVLHAKYVRDSHTDDEYISVETPTGTLKICGVMESEFNKAIRELEVINRSRD